LRRDEGRRECDASRIEFVARRVITDSFRMLQEVVNLER
jgi:hypothetical protein